MPLYGLICQVVGINSTATVAGASGRIPTADMLIMDKSRTISVEFDSTINHALQLEFEPLETTMAVHPGEYAKVNYRVKNITDQDLIVQAVPGITPWQATEHFSKIECFCFTQQNLAAGEEKIMPVQFVISKKLPQKYGTVTLSYTFMKPQVAGQPSNAVTTAVPANLPKSDLPLSGPALPDPALLSPALAQTKS